MQLRTLIKKIHAACGPDLLFPDGREIRPKTAHRTWGCCYIASEALYHIWGKQRGFKPHYYRYNYRTRRMKSDEVIKVTHWFLSDGKRIVDPTLPQFRYPPKYRNTVCCGFLTMKPSNRAKKLIRRINAV